MNKADLALKYPTFEIQADPVPGCTNCGGTGEFDMWGTAELPAPLVPCPCVCLSRGNLGRAAGLLSAPKALRAFTLVEMLVVLAVVGIIFTIGYMNLSRWVATNDLRAGMATVAAEVERSRSTAWRTSSNQPVTWTATSINGKPLDGGVQIVTPPASGLAYSAPYGELQMPPFIPTVGNSTAPQGWTFELVKGSRHAFVYLVGVTGKPTIGDIQ